MNMKRGDWICYSCNEHNFASRSACFKCKRSKTTTTTTTTTTTASQTNKKEDWRCQSCNEHNFASRTSCRKCAKLKPPSSNSFLLFNNNGGSGVEPKQTPAPPTFKKGDWYCDKCGKMNFGSRTCCFGCGQDRAQEPKPGNEGESEALSCKVCMERNCESCLPCGHILMCMPCALACNKCPVCREPYDESGVKQIFLS